MEYEYNTVMTILDLLKRKTAQLDYWVKNTFLILVVRFIFQKKINHSNILKIIIFRTGSLGDSICTLPAINALRAKYQKAEIHLMTASGGANLVSIQSLLQDGLVDEYIFYQKHSLKSLIKKLKDQNYDLFVLFPQAHAPFLSILRNLLFAKWIKAKSGIGFQICVTRIYPQVQAKYNIIPNVRDFFMSILKPIGILPLPYRDKFHLNPSKEDIDKIENIKVTNHLSSKDKNIALVVGAKRPQNRWPIAYFDQVIEFLLNHNLVPVLIGGSEDTAIASQLKNYTKTVDLTGQLSPVQSGLMMQHCQLTITNDTGPMHLAYASGARLIALFSSRDYPNLWFPPAENSFIFRTNNIHCSECFTETCSDNLCMKQITPDMVIRRFKIELQIN